MKKFFISVFLGITAGALDIIPMIIQKLDFYANLSAFIHWVTLGIIINYTVFKIPGWLKGIVIAELTAIPIVLITFRSDPFSLFPIFVFSALLGAFVGGVGEKFAK